MAYHSESAITQMGQGGCGGIEVHLMGGSQHGQSTDKGGRLTVQASVLD